MPVIRTRTSRVGKSEALPTNKCLTQARRIHKTMNERNPQVIGLHSEGETKIYFGEKATRELKFHPHLLRNLIMLQINETYEVPSFCFWKTRGRLKTFLKLATQGIAPLPVGVPAGIYRRLMKVLYPHGWFFGWTKEEELEWAWGDTNKLLEQNTFALAKIQGEIVAIAAYTLGGKLENNEDVYEITKSITLPEFRGRGLNSALRAQLIQVIRERHTDALIMSFTKNKTVINRCKAMGWREISLEEYSEITKRVGRSGLSPEVIAALQHWRGFLFDPRRNYCQT